MPSYRLTFDDLGHPWLDEEVSGCFPHEPRDRKPAESDSGWTLSPGASDYTEPARDDRPRSTPFHFAAEVPA